MNHLATVLFGPLAGPECRRASSRGWPILVRTLAASAAMMVVLSIIWVGWFDQRIGSVSPTLLRIAPSALMIVEGMALTVALVVSPAVLAGSFAGEKERGTLGLLVISRMSAREIVSGRLVSRLSQVGLIMLAVLPAILLLASLAGLGLVAQLMLVLLPAAVAFGGGGLALAASVLSRRGRDALLLVYLLDLLCLVSPLLGSAGFSLVASDWVGVLNPYGALGALARQGAVGLAVGSAGFWTTVGLAGLIVAAWRLHPACLAAADGSAARGASRRRRWVPPLDERPMLWKELHIERVDSLGKVGRWIELLLVALLGGGSLAFAMAFAWFRWVRPDAELLSAVTAAMSTAFDRPADLFVTLIQWAIGLRAAVAIASERERGTWDALLTSPLTGREIVLSKLWGSLVALRLLVGAGVLSWTLSLLCGAMHGWEYTTVLADCAIVGAYMAAVGVRTSLRASTATRAMTITVVLWLAAQVVVSVVAAIIVLIVGSVANYVQTLLGLSGMGPLTGPLMMRIWAVGWPIAYYVLYAALTILIVAETALRFDRLAGRMVAGEAAIAVDHLVHGAPTAPVWMGPGDPPRAEPIGASAASPKSAMLQDGLLANDLL